MAPTHHLGSLQTRLKELLNAEYSVMDTAEPHLPTPPLLRLPPELIREILCYTRQWEHPLEAFKLYASVCSSLLPFVREHLFFSVAFFPNDRRDNSHPAQSLPNIATYAPHLLSYTRRMYIDVSTLNWSESLQLEKIRHLVSVLSTRAVNLREIALQTNNLGVKHDSYPSKDTWELLFPLFEKCSRLSLIFSAPPSRIDLRWILTRFPHIESLSLHVTSFGPPREKVSTEPRESVQLSPFLRLRELAYQDWTELAEVWMTSFMDLSVLRSVSVSKEVLGSNLGDLPRIVQLGGSFIREINLNIHVQKLQSAIEETFPFLPHLVNLDLSIYEHGTWCLDLTMLQDIIRSLRNSAHLRVISIHGRMDRGAGTFDMFLDHARALLLYCNSCPLLLTLYDRWRRIPELLEGTSERRTDNLHALTFDYTTLEVTDHFDEEELNAKDISRVELKATTYGNVWTLSMGVCLVPQDT